MERIDFDQLCKKAYHTESSVKAKDELWLEVFKLPEWYFIARGVHPKIYPYIAEANLIEPHSHWIYAFTESQRAIYFAKKNNLETLDRSSPVLTIPNNDKIIPWLQQFTNEGVKGVFFNADGHGFFVPIVQLAPIQQHLLTSYPTEL